MADRRGELADLLQGLSREPRVYVRAGRLHLDSGRRDDLVKAIAREVRALVVDLYEGFWHRYACEGPASAAQIERSLYPKTSMEAVALMREYASADLMFSSPFMDPTQAEAIAERIVGLLGAEARWWSNRDDVSSDGLVGCTLDGLVVGSDGHHFAALIQVADD